MSFRSAEEQEEQDELLEQSFILRLPTVVAEKLQDKMQALERTGRNWERHRNSTSRTDKKKYTKIYSRAVEAISDYIRIEPAYDPTTNEPLGDERFHFFIGTKCYPAKMFFLPCLTETYASVDRLGPPRPGGPKKSGDLTKSGDIGEILVVHDAPRRHDTEGFDWTWTEDPKLVYTRLEASRTQKDDTHRTLREGLTHPTKNIYTLRWAGEDFSNGWYPLRKATPDEMEGGHSWWNKCRHKHSY